MRASIFKGNKEAGFAGRNGLNTNYLLQTFANKAYPFIPSRSSGPFPLYASRPPCRQPQRLQFIRFALLCRSFLFISAAAHPSPAHCNKASKHNAQNHTYYDIYINA